MDGQLVVGGRQGRVRGQGAVLGFIEPPLGVFDADAHGEGLAFHGDSGVQQHLEGIPGAVAHGQDQRAAPAGADASVLFPGDGGEAAAGAGNAGQAAAELHAAAQCFNAAAQRLHHRHQYVGPNVGFGVQQDVVPGAGLVKLLQDPANAGITDAGIQFAVGESAGAALPKLDVAGGIQPAGFPKGFHFAPAGFSVLAPFQHNGPEAGFRQHQRGKYAAGAEPGHHGPDVGLPCRRWDPVFIPVGKGELRRISKPPQQLRFILPHRNVHGVYQTDVAAFPGVHGFFLQLQLPDLLHGDPQLAGGQLPQLRLVLSWTQGEITDTDHKAAPPSPAAARPARRPEDQAHCRLKPPQSPSMSSTSPQA